MGKKSPDAQSEAPPLDPVEERLARLRDHGQRMASEEKYAPPPPVPPSPARPQLKDVTDEAPEPVEERDETPPQDNAVHDHLEEIKERLHVEVPEAEVEEPVEAAAPAPPPARPKRPHPALRKVRKQAVMFRQHVPPKHEDTHLSFWGGCPRLPESFEWPTFTKPDGTKRALSFVGQIDCSQLPGSASFQLLPETGVLAFFMDLHWGAYWEWKVVHVDGDTAEFVELDAPSALPHLYDSKLAWGWPRRDEDWPRLLPKWSFDPVTITAKDSADAVDPEKDREQSFWPGAIDRDTAAEAIAEYEADLDQATDFEVSYDDKKALERPFEAFPQDWDAIRIALGHLERHIADPYRKGTQKGDKALTGDLTDWRRKVERAEKAERPLSRTMCNDFWKMLKKHDGLVAPCLSQIVVDSIEATLAAGHADKLPEEALAYVRARHRFSAGDERMLCAPTFVQMEAEERVGEWLLLLEMGANPPIGHHFAEGVYQFWIRPEDLAAGNFDAVELSAEAY
ncbi:DUF1963 domain-containing protein [Sphingomicrobium sediminis]|uniref:YwqG family protein n=1 Tax=Sphingomicrobium sediminis TaxID=2950949 RepID=A0A9X2EI40_9SPHN|nr:DUF1963 domain-containing protein [Sphingomicrobium sediminis]MCM8557161.1 YwqG family protein [Sphingomicrobium sediminis]